MREKQDRRKLRERKRFRSSLACLGISPVSDGGELEQLGLRRKKKSQEEDDMIRSLEPERSAEIRRKFLLKKILKTLFSRDQSKNKKRKNDNTNTQLAATPPLTEIPPTAAAPTREISPASEPPSSEVPFAAAASPRGVATCPISAVLRQHGNDNKKKKNDNKNTQLAAAPPFREIPPAAAPTQSQAPSAAAVSLRCAASSLLSAVSREENNDQFLALCVLATAMITMIMFGRLSAILCTSAWLYFLPRLRAAAIPARTIDTPELDLDSEEYKRRVVLEGLLQRNPPRSG